MGWAKYMEDNLEIMENRMNAYHRTAYITAYSPRITEPVTSHHQIVINDIPIDELILPKPLICRDCGCKIKFATEQQNYYSKMGWKPPKRCKKCRAARDIHASMRPSF